METEKGMEQNIQKVLEFWLRLYGLKYRVRKTLNSQMRGLRRTLSQGDRALSQSILLISQISAEFPLHDELPLDTEDIHRFQIILENFAHDIASIIANPASLFALAKRVQILRAEYNEMVSRMEGQFLTGFGPIYAKDVSMPELQHLQDFFRKLRKARELPRKLAYLHEKQVRDAINTSLDHYLATKKFRTMKIGKSQKIN